MEGTCDQTHFLRFHISGFLDIYVAERCSSVSERGLKYTHYL